MPPWGDMLLGTAGFDTHVDTHICANNAKFLAICDITIKDIKNKNSLKTTYFSGLQAVFDGRGDGIRTHGLFVPNELTNR